MGKQIKIGIDIDEVLADFMNPLIKFHNNRYGTSFKRNDFASYNLWETWGGTKEEASQKIHDFYDSNYFSEGVNPIYGSLMTISLLNSNNNLFVITSRNEKIKNKTVSWIGDYFPKQFSDLYFTNNKRKKSDICINQGINILVEDSLEYSFECASKGIDVLLMDCPWNKFTKQKTHEKIKRVYGWKGVLKEMKRRGFC